MIARRRPPAAARRRRARAAKARARRPVSPERPPARVAAVIASLAPGERISWSPGQDPDRLRAALWLASGPGRAWRVERWAQSVKDGKERLDLARNVIALVARIRELYRAGNGRLADILVERAERMVERAGYLKLFDLDLLPLWEQQRRAASQPRSKVVMLVRDEIAAALSAGVQLTARRLLDFMQQRGKALKTNDGYVGFLDNQSHVIGYVLFQSYKTLVSREKKKMSAGSL
ncbi:MAG TPA: hypothetical protein VNK67_13365 [Burkholderiales bacterium]|nr:hypothetical protein [Burkholderiales bacterium]